MQSGAWALARELKGPPPDGLLVSDYLDLSRLAAFAPAAWRDLPTVVYFHENQLTYPLAPDEKESERDFSFGFANILSCIKADRVVFNSQFHCDEFRDAAEELLRRLPRPNPRQEFARAMEDARIIAPGIECEEFELGAGPQNGNPLRLAFNHRWEHDKDPEAFLEAALKAQDRGAQFELVLLGETYQQMPLRAEALLACVGPQTVHRGFTKSRAEYGRLLASCDLIVSTARHEFFGMAMLEAMAAGCTPLLPKRLAYPEVLPDMWHAEGLYESDEDLCQRILQASQSPEQFREPARRSSIRKVSQAYAAATTASALDRLWDELCGVP